jgi:hypothetical protein
MRQRSRAARSSRRRIRRNNMWDCLGSVAVAIVLIAALPGRAQQRMESGHTLWEPPRVEWPTKEIRGPVIHRISVGGFPNVLNQTPLGDAKRTLGGTIGSGGDAGNAEAWLCFHGSDESGTWIFWLTSIEIDGDTVGGFTWKHVETGTTIDSRCRNLRGSNPIRLQLPLHIGMTRAEALKILGDRASVGHSEMVNMRRVQKVIDGTQYTISNGIEVALRKGAVVQVAAFESGSD